MIYDKVITPQNRLPNKFFEAGMADEDKVFEYKDPIELSDIYVSLRNSSIDLPVDMSDVIYSPLTAQKDGNITIKYRQFTAKTTYKVHWDEPIRFTAPVAFYTIPLSVKRVYNTGVAKAYTDAVWISSTHFNSQGLYVFDTDETSVMMDKYVKDEDYYRYTETVTSSLTKNTAHVWFNNSQYPLDVSSYLPNDNYIVYYSKALEGSDFYTVPKNGQLIVSSYKDSGRAATADINFVCYPIITS